jgi:hypothetical protein
MQRDHDPGIHQFPVMGPGVVGDLYPLARQATAEQGQGGFGERNRRPGIPPPGFYPMRPMTETPVAPARLWRHNDSMDKPIETVGASESAETRKTPLETLNVYVPPGITTAGDELPSDRRRGRAGKWTGKRSLFSSPIPNILSLPYLNSEDSKRCHGEASHIRAQ